MEKGMIKNRSATLSEEQYDLVVSYLNTGRKPALDRLKKAKLYGKMNGGAGVKNCPGYFRFKSIVKRLDLRPSDGALIFKANGKVVLPNNQFTSTIKEVHSSAGYKHLHITATLAKLSEKYTVGCRQFGITEERVRAVIKACREGSCADKYANRQGFSIMKNLVKPGCQQENKDSKSNLANTQGAALICPQVDKTENQTKQQPAMHEPSYAILDKLPNGCFIIKQIIMKPKNSTSDPINFSSTSTITPINSVAVMKNLPSLQSPIIPTNNAAVMNKMPILQSPITPINNVAVMNNMPILQSPITPINNVAVMNNMPILQSPITPINNVAVMNNMPSLQSTFFINAKANSANIKVSNCLVGTNSGENTAPQLPQPIMGTTQFAIPVNFSFSKFPNLNNNHLPKETLIPMIFQPGCNANSSSESSKKIGLAPLEVGIMDFVSESLEKITEDDAEEATDSCDEDIYQSNGDEATIITEDQPMEIDKKSEEKTTVMFPNFWYNQADMDKEKEPFKLINLAIKDMRLDVLKSIRGHNSSMDRLQSKIDAVTKMVDSYRVLLNHNRPNADEAKS